MKIVVIGAGAMGSIYGGRLSLHNEVTLVDTNPKVVEAVAENGLKLQENGMDNIYHPAAKTSTKGMDFADLVIVLVKAPYTKAALSSDRNVIGPDTYVITLQNGSGHEDILSGFVDLSHIIIGKTEDDGTVLGAAYIRHGGVGNTNVGMLTEDKENFLPKLKEAFDGCGFNVRIQPKIQQLIWNKLFTNVSLSTVTGLLQVNMGYIAKNEYAWNLTMMLLHEAVETAHALGLEADEAALAEQIRPVHGQMPDEAEEIRLEAYPMRQLLSMISRGDIVDAKTVAGITAYAARQRLQS